MKLAVIGGSLLKTVNKLENRQEEQVKTPFGATSDVLVTGDINGVEFVYCNRHGFRRHIAPHQVNYKANMFALKLLDVTHIIAVTAVGGITEAMSPMTWITPDQLIDYTHGRMHTYNDGDAETVNHIDFTYPFTRKISARLHQAAISVTDQVVSGGTYGVTQGPRLETAAEISRMECDGCDIVGMTAMPEAALSRELEMDYANLSLVVNWAAGKAKVYSRGDEPELISLEEIQQRVKQGNLLAEKIIQQYITSI